MRVCVCMYVRVNHVICITGSWNVLTLAEHLYIHVICTPTTLTVNYTYHNESRSLCLLTAFNRCDMFCMLHYMYITIVTYILGCSCACSRSIIISCYM